MKWSLYFYKIAQVVAEQSKCLSRQIGAVLVHDRVVVATGYNGPPRDMTHCDIRHDFLADNGAYLKTCPRRLYGYKSGEGLHLCPAVHAEANCIANAARVGVDTKKAVMYMTCGIPCKDCLALIINAGIARLVCSDYLNFYDNLSREIVTDSNLIIDTY